jgi:WD40 repeat protein
VISVDLEGNLKYLQEGNEKPVKVVRGHQKAITAAGCLSESKTLWTGSYEGRARSWDLTSGAAQQVDGEMHSNYVSGIAASPQEGRIYSVGWDDTLRTIDASQQSFIGNAVKTDGQPKGVTVATVGGKPHTLVVTNNGISVYADGSEVSKQKTPSPPTCIAATGETVAVGSEDKKVRLFKAGSPASFDSMTELKDITHPPSSLAFSPDGSHLAVGLSNGKIFVYSNTSGSWTLETNRWSAHTARVTCIAWSPDGKKAVSGGLDTSVFVWSLADPGKRIKALNTHKEGVGGVVWAEDSKVVSCGADAAVKVWQVEGVS